MLTPRYIHLPSGSAPKALEIERPFAAIVIIDAEVASDWRDEVSAGLVKAGCLNMMAWGHDCSLWDESVDWAFGESRKFGNGRHDHFFSTSWHEHESLEDVCHFAISCVELLDGLIRKIVILDITEMSREDEILARYQMAQDEIVDVDAQESEDNRGGRQSGALTYAVLGLIVILLAIAPPLYYWLTR